MTFSDVAGLVALVNVSGFGNEHGPTVVGLRQEQRWLARAYEDTRRIAECVKWIAPGPRPVVLVGAARKVPEAP